MVKFPLVYAKSDLYIITQSPASEGTITKLFQMVSGWACLNMLLHSDSSNCE